MSVLRHHQSPLSVLASLARLITDGIIQSDQGLKFELDVYFSGTMNWDAMATGYGNVGASYSANKNYVWGSPTYTIGSQITQPGSVY
ncbi:MAG: hypothetical protein L7G99_07285 [Vulcanisaeta sp.]|nr:hypothetical protein [Vulcanisaeta sp.]